MRESLLSSSPRSTDQTALDKRTDLDPRLRRRPGGFGESPTIYRRPGLRGMSIWQFTTARYCVIFIWPNEPNLRSTMHGEDTRERSRRGLASNTSARRRMELESGFGTYQHVATEETACASQDGARGQNKSKPNPESNGDKRTRKRQLLAFVLNRLAFRRPFGASAGRRSRRVGGARGAQRHGGRAN
jgi:hypothetical protein